MNNVRSTFTQQHRVVLCEPDRSTRKVLADRLAGEDFDVEATTLPSEMFRAIDRRPAALVVAALLPRRGVQLLGGLREHSAAPILVLLWAAGDLDVPEALDAGADDALERPFSPRLFGARCRALVRRLAATPPSVFPRVLTFDGLSIDPTTREVEVSGERVPLTPKEFDLLRYL